MHKWVVGGAVIESSVLARIGRDPSDGGGPGDGLLLVQNLRRGGAVDWTPPGGVIDHGESVLGGLTREVEEETGLVVLSWSGLLYEIEAVAPGLGWTLRVEVHRAIEVSGHLRTGEDPDGIVVGADVVPLAQCADRLGGSHPWVREPLMDWVLDRWAEPRVYRYHVDGSDPGDLRVSRSPGPAA